MVARIHTVAFQGIEVLPIEVQVQMVPGLPNFVVVGSIKPLGKSKPLSLPPRS
jgi:magnesium chelatase family protein